MPADHRRCSKGLTGLGSSFEVDAAQVMVGNRWQTAVRYLEVAVHPDTRDPAVIAAVNDFRRTAGGVPFSQVCIEFACGGIPLAELARIKDSLERLDRENSELRRRLAADEAAQAGAQARLDAAYQRIHELTQQVLAAPAGAATAELDLADEPAALIRTGSGRLNRTADRPPSVHRP